METPARFVAQLEQLGVTVPTDVAATVAALVALDEAARRNPAAEAQREALDGSLTAQNAAQVLGDLSRALVEQDRAQAAANILEQPLRSRFNGQLRDAADGLIAQLRQPFDQAAVVVQAAGQMFGPDPSAEDLVKAGPQAVEVHQKLAGALGVLSRIRMVRVGLAEVAGHGEQDVTWWIAPVASEAELDRARLAFGAAGDGFHNVCHAGFALRMNTATEAEAVATGAAVATSQAEAAERDARIAEEVESWRPALEAGERRAREADRAEAKRRQAALR